MVQIIFIMILYTTNNLRLPFVTIDKFHSENEIIIDKNNLIFVYAGSPGKNFSKDRLDIVIKAFANSKSQHNNFTLNIVGLSKDELLKIDTIRDDIINLDSNLVCFGRVRNEESINIIKKSNLVVIFWDFSKIPPYEVRSNTSPSKISRDFHGFGVFRLDTKDLV